MPPAPDAPLPEPAERLFLALWPDAGVRARLAAAARGLSPRGGRLVPAQNLHLTLAFFGDTSAARRECLERALAEVTASAFELAFGEPRYRRRAGMIWLEASETPAPLREPAAAASAAASACGHAPQPRPFRAHVTLARGVRGLGARSTIPPIAWRVRDFCLVRSTLAPEGSTYEVLRRWPLVS